MVAPSGSSARIAVDAMGGDLGPSEVVAAVKLALESEPDLNAITLVGQPDVLKPLVDGLGLTDHPKVSVFGASEIILMDDKPLQALKRKKDASMVRAIELVKAGQAGAVVSCGNTGALMAGGTLKLRTLAGVDRPALAAIIPRENGHFILIDAGANPDARPEHLVHNALLGSHYARVIFGCARPRVGLLTIGTEEGKGNELSTATHELLKRTGDLLHYAGPTEGFEVFRDHCDVAVCNGFVGNLLLKSWESLAKFFSNTLKTELRANPLRMTGAFMAQGAFAALKRRINPDEYAGAPLLGLRGNILKAHGSSTRHAIKSAILAAGKVIDADFLHLVEADVARANLAIQPPAAVPAP